MQWRGRGMTPVSGNYSESCVYTGRVKEVALKQGRKFVWPQQRHRDTGSLFTPCNRWKGVSSFRPVVVEREHSTFKKFTCQCNQLWGHLRKQAENKVLREPSPMCAIPRQSCMRKVVSCPWATEWASKYCSFTTTSALTSFNDGLWPGSISQIHSSIAKLFWTKCFITATEK